MPGFGSLADGFVEFSTKGMAQVHAAVDGIKKKISGLAKPEAEDAEGFKGFGEMIGAAVGGGIGATIGSFLSEALSKAISSLVELFKGMFKDMFQGASDLERMRAEFTQLTGSAKKAEEVISGLKDAFRGTSINTEAWAKAARDMTISGLSSQEIILRMRQLGSISVATGESIEGMTRAYERATISGKVSMRTLMAMPPVAEQLAKDFHVSEEALAEMAGKGQVKLRDLNRALEEVAGTGTRIGGILAAQKNTWQGQWDTMTANFKGAFTELGTVIAEAFNFQDATAAAAEFWKIIKDAVSLFKDIGPLLSAVFTPMIEQIRGVLHLIGEAIEGLKKLQEQYRKFKEYASIFASQKTMFMFGWNKMFGKEEAPASAPVPESSGGQSKFEFTGLTQLAEKMQQEAGAMEFQQQQVALAQQQVNNTATIAGAIENGAMKVMQSGGGNLVGSLLSGFGHAVFQ